MLEYDDSAFYYFCMTILSFYILPGTYYFIFKQVLPAVLPGKDPELSARTEVSTSSVLYRIGTLKVIFIIVEWVRLF